MGTNEVRAVGMSCSFNSFNSFDYPIITAQTYKAQRKIKLLIHNMCSSNWASLFSTSLPFACVWSLQAPLCLLFITHVTGCCDVQSPTRVGNGRTCVCFNAHYPLSLLHPSSWALLLHILKGLLRYVFMKEQVAPCLSYSIVSSGFTHLSE